MPENIKIKEYWKVHRDNLKYFKNVSSHQLKIWKGATYNYTDLNIKSCYIYICINFLKNGEIEYSYMPYSKYSDNFFNMNSEYKYIYKGEYGLKENRFEKLQKIYNNLTSR